jgi:hypothetical protein
MRESQRAVETRNLGLAVGARRGDLRRRATPLYGEQLLDFPALLR